MATTTPEGVTNAPDMGRVLGGYPGRVVEVVVVVGVVVVVEGALMSGSADRSSETGAVAPAEQEVTNDTATKTASRRYERPGFRLTPALSLPTSLPR